MKPITTGSLALVAALLVDQVTKAIIVDNAGRIASGHPIFPGFNLVFGRNDGVSFGLLDQAPWWSLSVLAGIICIVLAVMLFRATNRIEAVAYGAIIGGALGNVVDRLRFGAVTDFLDFYVGSLHWPAFNLADVFVVGGVALLCLVPDPKPSQA